jgi:hypothetical protein
MLYKTKVVSDVDQVFARNSLLKSGQLGTVQREKRGGPQEMQVCPEMLVKRKHLGIDILSYPEMCMKTEEICV